MLHGNGPYAFYPASDGEDFCIVHPGQVSDRTGLCSICKDSPQHGLVPFDHETLDDMLPAEAGRIRKECGMIQEPIPLTDSEIESIRSENVPGDVRLLATIDRYRQECERQRDLLEQWCDGHRPKLETMKELGRV